MDKHFAIAKACQLMVQFKLHERGWKLEIDDSVSHLGICRHGRKVIGLSQRWIEACDETECTDTILHEIAHALLPAGEKHSPTWKILAKSIGCSGNRLASTKFKITKKFYAICSHCGSRFATNRRKTSACTTCCRKYNNGQFTHTYLLTWHRLR